MKKLTVLLLLSVLLLTVPFAAGEKPADLYDLYDLSAGERTWIGTGIPILEQGVLVTSAAVLPGKSGKLAVWDGKGYRNVIEVLRTGKGKVLVVLYETEGEGPGIPAYTFAGAGESLQAGNMLVRSGDWMQSRINRAVYDLNTISWQNLDSVILTLSGDTQPGAALLTADGKLAGMIAAEYAEGEHRYIALTADQITDCILEASEKLGTGNTEPAPPEGYRITLEHNIAVFDWSDAELPVIPKGYKRYHIVADTESGYLTFSQLFEGNTSVSMLLTPGRTYKSGFLVMEDGRLPDRIPDECALTRIPDAEPLTDYSFRSRILAIAENPGDGSMPEPLEEITEDLLRSGEACILSVTSYVIDETTPSTDMLITLTAPDGNNYRYAGGWYYDAAVQDNDWWVLTMDETGLLNMLDSKGYPEGVYELCLYIEGKLADSFSFTLIK